MRVYTIPFNIYYRLEPVPEERRGRVFKSGVDKVTSVHEGEMASVDLDPRANALCLYRTCSDEGRVDYGLHTREMRVGDVVVLGEIALALGNWGWVDVHLTEDDIHKEEK